MANRKNRLSIGDAIKLFQKNDDHLVEDYTASLIKSDDRAHIQVDLRHGNQIYETYSSHHDLCSPLYDYVQGVSKYVPVVIPLTIDFKITEAMKGDAIQIERMFLTNFRFEFDEKKDEAKKIKRKGLVMMAVGIFFLIVDVVFMSLQNLYPENIFYFVLNNVFSIVSWVFIWDAVDKWAFEERDVQREAIKMAQLALSNIRFLVEEEDQVEDNPEDKK